MQEMRNGWLGRRLLTGLMGALVICAVSLGVAPAALAQQGGVGAAAVPQFPSSVTVGDQDVNVSLSVQNQSTGEYADDTFRVDDITLTPSCDSFGFATCPPGGEDPGVFVPSATGVGRAGTACAGQTFTIILLDPATGRYRFVPNSPVILGPTGTAAAMCIIDFTVDVVRAPTKDSNPAQPGLQTNQYATVELTDITPGPTFGQSGSARGSGQTTVLQAAPQIATQVNDATITLGESFTDTATVTAPPGAPTPTGTVDFFVYGPDDATCAGVPVASSLNRPMGPGGTVTSGVFTPTTAGIYRVIARYSGDANYHPITGRCNDPGETVVVARATPAIATQVNDASITLGETFTDTARVIGEPGAPTPTGTVDFVVFGPDDTNCTGAPVASSLNRTLIGGAATSDTFSPGATGTYRVIASYSGDANYGPVSGACNDPNETVVVEAPPPPPMPTSKEQCMKGGWRAYGVFKNQGDCVSFVATKGKNPPVGPKK